MEGWKGNKMNSLNRAIISAGNATLTLNSNTVDGTNLFSVSVQAVFSVANSGTLKLQASNDYDPDSVNISGNYTPTNWSDITGASHTIAAATTAFIPKTEVSNQWIRAVWTPTAGAGTVTVRVKTIGY